MKKMDLALGRTWVYCDRSRLFPVPGIKQVPRNPQKGAGGHLNFADGKGNMILLASFLTAEEFDFYRSEEGLVKEKIPGLGDEAFSGPATGTPYMVVMRKGSKGAALSTFFETAEMAATRLSMDHLISLGKIVLSRL
ncbi:MAG: hypothetical protein FJY81_06265 [Candidatus Aminicenantes bacterium]|nr:hypothetical protein [Candidatus Aminicenantes bacterium]